MLSNIEQVKKESSFFITYKKFSINFFVLEKIQVVNLIISGIVPLVRFCLRGLVRGLRGRGPATHNV